MPANTSAIFPLSPNVNGLASGSVLSKPLSTALTAGALYEGTTAFGTAINEYFTAGANGSRVEKIRFKLGNTAGATASGSTTATVARVWINNGSTNTTATNNVLFDEVTLPITAISASAKTTEYEIAMGISLPPGYRILIGLGAVAGGTNCAWIPTVVGSDY